jgi:hypothetical protein
VSTLLLGADDRRNLLVLALVRLRAIDRLRPRGAVRGIAGKKRGHGTKIERVICRQAPDPWETTDVDRDPRQALAGERRIGWIIH